MNPNLSFTFVLCKVTDDGNVLLDNFVPYLQPGHKIGKVSRANMINTIQYVLPRVQLMPKFTLIVLAARHGSEKIGPWFISLVFTHVIRGKALKKKIIMSFCIRRECKS